MYTNTASLLTISLNYLPELIQHRAHHSLHRDQSAFNETASSAVHKTPSRVGLPVNYPVNCWKGI